MFSFINSKILSGECYESLLFFFFGLTSVTIIEVDFLY